MSELLNELKQLETELHRAETRRNRSRLGELLHPDFEEFGRSGRKYSREEILAEGASRAESAPIVSMDFDVAQIGEGLALLTYTSALQGETGDLRRRALRSSLWVRTDTGWRMRFHQGTPTDG